MVVPHKTARISIRIIKGMRRRTINAATFCLIRKVSFYHQNTLHYSIKTVKDEDFATAAPQILMLGENINARIK